MNMAVGHGAAMDPGWLVCWEPSVVLMVLFWAGGGLVGCCISGLLGWRVRGAGHHAAGPLAFFSPVILCGAVMHGAFLMVRGAFC